MSESVKQPFSISITIFYLIVIKIISSIYLDQMQTLLQNVSVVH
jgi:hypothetical protein